MLSMLCHTTSVPAGRVSDSVKRLRAIDANDAIVTELASASASALVLGWSWSWKLVLRRRWCRLVLVLVLVLERASAPSLAGYHSRSPTHSG